VDEFPESIMSEKNDAAAADDDDAGLYDDLDIAPSPSSNNISNFTTTPYNPKQNDVSQSTTHLSSGAASASALSWTAASPPFAANSLTAQVDSLTATVQQLTSENDVLKRNMGILFRTARAELQRKDEEIARLQTELDSKS
jgi:predicted RNase H-like nuclease (RuvC/YqgF family)